MQLFCKQKNRRAFWRTLNSMGICVSRSMDSLR